MVPQTPSRQSRTSALSTPSRQPGGSAPSTPSPTPATQRSPRSILKSPKAQKSSLRSVAFDFSPPIVKDYAVAVGGASEPPPSANAGTKNSNGKRESSSTEGTSSHKKQRRGAPKTTKSSGSEGSATSGTSTSTTDNSSPDLSLKRPPSDAEGAPPPKKQRRDAPSPEKKTKSTSRTGSKSSKNKDTAPRPKTSVINTQSTTNSQEPALCRNAHEYAFAEIITGKVTAFVASSVLSVFYLHIMADGGVDCHALIEAGINPRYLDPMGCWARHPQSIFKWWG
ncbi:hypothetical protein BDN72DRAFT_866280 [Pluteus cervinus]|uniref:Uncharacterized protein n=1 Tax=Pluteus cervinus TaxID=181527 RepID=A0ACD2ZZF7_9AGAR|nr:hypothetical protein BDN72DRAFT_866280 [Pluteus cervinus]